MKDSYFPPGWDEDRVRQVLSHYELQTEDEAVAEDEAAFSQLRSPHAQPTMIDDELRIAMLRAALKQFSHEGTVHLDEESTNYELLYPCE